MKKTLRTALLADDLLNKDTSKNIKIEIDIEKAVKVFSLSQTDGNGINVTINRSPDLIEYNLSVEKIFTPKKADVDVINALVDPMDDSRFIYIGHAVSKFLNNVEVFWYDSKYKDIIIIPDLKTLTEAYNVSTTVDLENRIFKISGRCINSSLNTGSNNNLSTDSIDGHNSALPVPNDITGISTHILMVNNLFDQSHINNSGYMVPAGDRYVEGHFAKWLECFSLGGTDTLFTDTLVDSTLIYRTRRNFFTTKYIGPQNLDDMLIPNM